MPELNRRQFVSQTGRLAVGLSLLPLRLPAARPPSYGEQWPDMLLSFLSKKLNALAARWDQERSKITTVQALEARNLFVREKFKEMIPGNGPLPEAGM